METTFADREAVLDNFQTALAAVEEIAPDLTIADGARLSDYQVRLGAIVLEIVDVTKTLLDLEGGR